MLKKKNGTIAALTLSFVLVLGGGVFAYEEIQEKEEIVAVQKENLSQLETEKEALEKDKATKEKEIAEKNKAIEKTKDTLSDKEKALSDKEKALKEKEKALKEKNKVIEKKDAHIEELKEDLSAKAKREKEELKAKEEVVVASVAPTSSVVKQPSVKQASVKQASAPVEKKAQPVQVSRSEEEPTGRTFYVEATAYTALCDTGCTGVTATGINLLENPGLKVIAVDPSVIPLGSKVHVEGYGYAIAGDTGGAIKGNKIDLYVQNHSDAVAFGRKQLKITILK